MAKKVKNKTCSISCSTPPTCNKNGCSSTTARIIDAVPVTEHAEQPMIANPVAAIKTHATNFDAIYSNYNVLRLLARPLNGLSQADEFPENIRVTNVQIVYELDGTQYSAQITKLNTVGEIAPLLAAALREHVDSIKQELDFLDQTTTAVKNAVNAVRNGPQPNTQ